ASSAWRTSVCLAHQARPWRIFNLIAFKEVFVCPCFGPGKAGWWPPSDIHRCPAVSLIEVSGVWDWCPATDFRQRIERSGVGLRIPHGCAVVNKTHHTRLHRERPDPPAPETVPTKPGWQLFHPGRAPTHARTDEIGRAHV